MGWYRRRPRIRRARPAGCTVASEEPVSSPWETEGGPRLTPVQVAGHVVDTGLVDWRSITVTAVIWAESGGYAWARPIINKPGEPDHLSVDRGICQFNSYWWHHVADRIAYDPAFAIPTMVNAVRTDGWSLDLRWWNTFTSGAYQQHVPAARQAVNAVLVARGGTPL